jgi:hypothetical protein
MEASQYTYTVLIPQPVFRFKVNSLTRNDRLNSMDKLWY